MDVVVFGAGSLGSLIGGLLSRSHEVTLVGRAEHVAAVRESGLTVTGNHEFTATPAATTDGRDLAASVALVTVKSFDTAEAGATLATGTYDTVCSLQNGMGNEAVLAEHCEVPVVAGTATYGAVLEEPGQVRCTGTGTVTVGATASAASSAVDRVAELFASADVPVTVPEDMDRRLWQKLAVNAAINPITALAAVENGAVLAGETVAMARGAAREVAATARACDVALTDETALAALEDVVAATAANTSSMRQDVQAGRRTEIDAINGYVLERAPDGSTPTNHSLATLIRTWERERGLRD